MSGYLEKVLQHKHSIDNVDFRNLTGTTILRFRLKSYHKGELADWTMAIQESLKNVIRHQLLANYMVDVDSLSVMKFEGCANYPCENNGTCYIGWQGDYEYCSCRRGWDGHHCELAKDTLAISVYTTNLTFTNALTYESSFDYTNLRRDVVGTMTAYLKKILQHHHGIHKVAFG
ncbi:hypothetical protein LSAT2_027437 [Lamellibrachia satsuma]|nr:hypothetical protein LSAT2_027437 [Lamellibrachia satsuma]